MPSMDRFRGTNDLHSRSAFFPALRIGIKIYRHSLLYCHRVVLLRLLPLVRFKI